MMASGSVTDGGSLRPTNFAYLAIVVGLDKKIRFCEWRRISTQFVVKTLDASAVIEEIASLHRDQVGWNWRILVSAGSGSKIDFDLKITFYPWTFFFSTFHNSPFPHMNFLYRRTNIGYLNFISVRRLAFTNIKLILLEIVFCVHPSKGSSPLFKKKPNCQVCPRSRSVHHMPPFPAKTSTLRHSVKLLGPN